MSLLKCPNLTGKKKEKFRWISTSFIWTNELLSQACTLLLNIGQRETTIPSVPVSNEQPHVAGRQSISITRRMHIKV